MLAVRVLVVSPLSGYLLPLLERELEGSHVVAITVPTALEGAVVGQPRFDVALVDLTWNSPSYEWRFDGLDALGVLRKAGRDTPTIVSAQGHSFEDDHLDEALDLGEHPEVKGVIYKPDGLASVITAINAAVVNQPVHRPIPSMDPLYRHFSHGEGQTAARLAAAVASGNAANYKRLAVVADVAVDSANKLIKYLRPIIQSRKEAPPDEPTTQASVYRWCGEHARYLLSWYRRHPQDGHPEITRWTPPS